MVLIHLNILFTRVSKLSWQTCSQTPVFPISMEPTQSHGYLSQKCGIFAFIYLCSISTSIFWQYMVILFPKYFYYYLTTFVNLHYHYFCPSPHQFSPGFLSLTRLTTLNMFFIKSTLHPTDKVIFDKVILNKKNSLFTWYT